MKKRKRIFLLCFLLILPGCSRTKPQTSGRVVTGIHICCTQSGVTRELTYREPRKMEAVLNYLRCLNYAGKAQEDPETLPGDLYKITVVNSDGTNRVYRQRAFSYLCRNGETWEKIDPNRGKYLWLLLKLMPGD